ncbi:tail fiber domain-containing protein [Dyadobacter soli]|uniref:tail fiber domain-containing protein n=1 Tax=Dyadobacter soli TaxID=659014 RepID=UPI0015A3F19B|nr:tail fiber domain-containing protein [Dyadobacter soli]
MFAQVAASSVATAQLGVGTSLPQAKLHVYDGAFLSQTPALDPEISPFYDPVNFDTDPVYHGFNWIHEKGAFRASGTGNPSLAFDPVNAAKYSFAAGFDTFAAFGFAPTVFGMRSSAAGSLAFAIGERAIANDDFSFAQGNHSTANGPSCVTMGTNLENNFKIGAFIMGHTDFSAQSTDNHQIKMLFDGGYRLFTNGNVTIGLALNAGANSWSIISDAKAKENFEVVNAKALLSRVATMPISSWNYKGQDPKIFRHYGPMAQDFFKAFGKDSYGTVGSDKTINQADLDGVTLIAIQALVKETNELLKINEDLKIQLLKLYKQVSKNSTKITL